VSELLSRNVNRFWNVVVVPVAIAAGILGFVGGASIADTGFQSSNPALLGAPASLTNDLWFNIYFGNSRIGGSHITTVMGEYDNKPALVEQSETSTTIIAFGTPIEQHVTSNLWTDPSGVVPFYESVSIGSGGMATDVTVRFYTDHIDAVLVSGKSTTKKTVQIPPGVRVTANDFAQGIWTDKSVTLGQEFKQATFNPVTLKLDTYTIKVVGTGLSISDPVLGSVENLNQCQVVGPEGEMTVYQDAHGIPVKIEMPAGLVMRRDFAKESAGADTTLGAGPFRGAVYVPPVDFATASAVEQKGASIEKPRDCRKLKVEVTAPEAGTKVYTITSIVPKPTTTTVKELASNKTLAPMLANEAYLSLDSEAVKARAAKLRGKSDKVYDLVMKTRSWVHLTMHPTASFGLPRSAASVLTDPRGVCRDYAILYAALARAQGIPTRLCSGVVAFRDKFYYHAWAESFVGGSIGWLPVDPTMEGRVVDATHIVINRGDPVSIYELVGAIGRVKVKVLEVGY
jgi:hypothetical protein